MSVATFPTSVPITRRWTREEFYKLAEEGWFRGQRVLLLEGEIIQMPPMGHLHVVSLVKVTRWLHQTLDSNYVIRIQMPLNALKNSDPEPDAAVLRGPLEAMTDHPRSALLALEVSDSSLRLDRRKASLYAAAGVEDYWIINVTGRCIEVHRGPIADPQAEFGHRYATSNIIKEDQSIAPLAMPQAIVKASDLLP